MYSFFFFLFLGSVLNVETLSIKYEDTDPVSCLNTEKMCWMESGKANRVYVSAIRVFYVMGKPAFEAIGNFLKFIDGG